VGESVVNCEQRRDQRAIRLIARERAEGCCVTEEERNVPQLANGGVVYDRVLVVEEVVVGNRKLEVEAAIDRLKPRTTYHFRIVATNRLGKVYGKDETFTTKRRTRSSTH